MISFCKGAMAAYKVPRLIEFIDDPRPDGLYAYAVASIRRENNQESTSGLSKSAGGTGLPTVVMQNIATYLAAGWDFAGETANGVKDLWKMSKEGPSYPKLAWE
jgi:hypothetical protein